MRKNERYILQQTRYPKGTPERNRPMQDLVSLGKLCEITQRSPAEIQTALDALDIEPSLILNDVAHYDRDVVNRLRGYFFNCGRSD